MIKVDVVQGSREWLMARLGTPTASQFSRIITEKTLKPSASATGYVHELVAEYLLGEPLDNAETIFTDRGTGMEESARSWYEMQAETEVERVGFLLRDDRRCGCSPDGLVGTEGMIELKCPSAAVHVGYLLDRDGSKYKAQMQGNLWIAERNFIDFLSYNPHLPPALVRCYRDEPFITALAAALEQFCDQVDAAKAELTARGYGPDQSPEFSQMYYQGVG